MNELFVIIGAELILLASIAAMMIYNSRADVLSRWGADEIDHASSDGNRARRRGASSTISSGLMQSLLPRERKRVHQGNGGTSTDRTFRAEASDSRAGEPSAIRGATDELD
jgi:hypothetical protein